MRWSGLWKASKVRWMLLAVFLLGWLPRGVAQAAPAQADAKTFVYEVVSIHPSQPNGSMARNITPDGIRIWGFTVHRLLANAYNVITNDQLIGVPGWTDNARYDIDAKMDADTTTALDKLSREEKNQRRREMLQAILMDRFHLQVKREMKELPVYALVMAKGGPKMKKSAPNAVVDINERYGKNGITLEGQGFELSRLISILTSDTGRIVVDRTGLTGKYDFKLEYSSMEDAGSAEAGPSIFTAVQEQLGLKLESTKAPVETFTVEHIERPTEN